MILLFEAPLLSGTRKKICLNCENAVFIIYQSIVCSIGHVSVTKVTHNIQYL